MAKLEVCVKIVEQKVKYDNAIRSGVGTVLFEGGILTFNRKRVINVFSSQEFCQDLVSMVDKLTKDEMTEKLVAGQKEAVKFVALYNDCSKFNDDVVDSDFEMDAVDFHILPESWWKQVLLERNKLGEVSLFVINICCCESYLPWFVFLST
jgi:hypothetical protein